MKKRKWENEESSAVVGDQVQNYLRNLKVHRYIGLDEVHPKVLREVAEEMTKPPFTIFEKTWQSGEVPSD